VKGMFDFDGQEPSDRLFLDPTTRQVKGADQY
jgi:hypothetical protein